jgi:hypothetical protein
MERPILFSTPMAQAILDGRKTQTRRIIKPQGSAVCFDVAMKIDGSDKWPRNLDDDERYLSYMKCPYGKIGDILWCRETWQKIEGDRFIYKADSIIWGGKWKPSIFMPKAACRIKLEIINIRVEKLLDISEEEAKAEGVELYNNYDGTKGGWGAPVTFKEGYQFLWESINGKDSWNLNPWVWVISFKRIKP